jgi:hypothetical protein
VTDNLENHTQEMLRRMRAEQNARFDRIDTTLAEVLTQIRIHGTHISGLVQQENLTSAKLAELDLRLSLVEKRLELRDE